MSNPFRYFNSSPGVIRLVVVMYVRYPLSLRDVEDLLLERGVDICREAVRHWRSGGKSWRSGAWVWAICAPLETCRLWSGSTRLSGDGLAFARRLAARPLAAMPLAATRLVRDLIELVAQQAAHADIEDRNQQQAEEGGEQHAADHAGADLMAGGRTR